MIQCVPNFSEGRNQSVVESIVQAARDASSARIVDYSSDPDHNRMVVTFLGSGDEIRDAVFAASKQAVESIDMRFHTGVHPRIGAVDVVPIVPIRDITMRECVELSHLIGDDIAGCLGVPVYFYEESATLSSHVNLADIRRGGFEALSASELEGDRAPDRGPHRTHPTAGATVMGARGPLLAYNILLDTEDLPLAKSIAKKLRTGESELEGVKSIGLWLATRSRVQVSMNITKPEVVSLRGVYKFVEGEARSSGVEVLESEIIGITAKRYFGEASPADIKAVGFKDSQILENWL